MSTQYDIEQDEKILALENPDKHQDNNKGNYRSITMGSKSFITLGSFNNVLVGNSADVSVGPSESLKIGPALSVSIGGGVSVSYAMKAELNYEKVNKWSKGRISASVEDTQLSKDYNIYAVNRTDMMKDNKVYIGVDKLKPKNPKNWFFKEKYIEGDDPVIGVNYNNNLVSNIYIDGSEKKEMTGDETKRILGEVEYKSQKINISAYENLGSNYNAEAKLAAVNVSSKSEASVTISPSSIELKSDNNFKNSRIILEPEKIKLHPTGSPVLELKKEGAVTTADKWIFA
ncbi:hypothetical protein [Grimontia sp. NTOU-MAR1]|uniref:hypothetical protein n=1 Tax=Grimontia sp. NTOU-MAR1 TaxID=3111011 RepID=UPI002DBE8151|nr:hypothetical protein [Grimontia sp. NTOU-MAR1]WRV97754.1 hypothetical protein VP504_17260 [Grimontia sp. NTOU-MAR1]